MSKVTERVHESHNLNHTFNLLSGGGGRNANP